MTGLDDLCVRFIINLPQEELESVERICFQVEEAQWYYEDFIRPLDPDLPSLNLRNFCLRIFQHCPLLSGFSNYHHSAAFENFLQYKTRVPVRGAIMLNDAMDEVILVKGWKKGANWSFPRGKINKDESDLDCAVREVYEETGFDIQAAGLVPMKSLEVEIQHQHLLLFVFRGVPMDTHFEARTRKEISKIEWWKLSDLPTLKKKKQSQEGRGEDLASNANKFYMVAPFVVPLKKWISHQKKLEKSKDANQISASLELQTEAPAIYKGSPNGVHSVSKPENMELLTSGFQPLQQNTSLISPAELSEPSISTQDPSTQLKSLLRIPASNQGQISAQDTTSQKSSAAPPAESKKASTDLLALLRGGQHVQSSGPPQTPLEQIIQPSSVPRSPKPHHPGIPRESVLDPPPPFPYSPDHIGQNYRHQEDKPSVTPTRNQEMEPRQNAIAAWNNFETVSAAEDAEKNRLASEKRAARLAEEERTGKRVEPRLPVMQETWKQVHVNRDSNMRQTNQRQIISVAKRPAGGEQQPKTSQIDQISVQNPATAPAAQSNSAPNQSTRNIQNALNMQYPDIYRPAIPAANQLPLPKLTSHSSNLLNLFKSGSTAKPMTAGNEEETPTSFGPSASTLVQPAANSGSSGQVVNLMQSNKPTARTATNIIESAAPTFSTSPDSKRPPSAHQAALLDLFRKQSVPAVESKLPSQASLDVPANVVELSALSSPVHSREPSIVDAKNKQQTPPILAKAPSIAQKRSQAISTSKKPPVSATVNGPLNVPQFEMISRSSKESHQLPAAVEKAKKSPVTILSRPANAKSPLQSPQSIPQVGQLQRGRSPITSIPNGLETNQKPHTPELFQPQILRRPAQPEKQFQDQSMPPPPPRSVPSPLSEPEKPLPNADHKKTLLSLFTKDSPKMSPGISKPDYSAFVSPISARPSSFSLPPRESSSTLPYPRSRIGSVVSPLKDEGEVTPSPMGSGRRTPKTTSPLDRDFLLGYLEGVAKKEGR